MYSYNSGFLVIGYFCDILMQAKFWHHKLKVLFLSTQAFDTFGSIDECFEKIPNMVLGHLPKNFYVEHVI